ncbi:hypothetical protein JXB28_01595 [Candidatus Woesearchaeota archaeon]|nr:hypothetical protein [Candidatus Woesearchaeota archaeon]
MGFKTEEEIDEWLTLEKERLEQEFLENVNKDKERIPQFRKKYDSEMKKLLARYEKESFRMLEKQKSGKNMLEKE